MRRKQIDIVVIGRTRCIQHAIRRLGETQKAFQSMHFAGDLTAQIHHSPHRAHRQFSTHASTRFHQLPNIQKSGLLAVAFTATQNQLHVVDGIPVEPFQLIAHPRHLFPVGAHVNKAFPKRKLQMLFGRQIRIFVLIGVEHRGVKALARTVGKIHFSSVHCTPVPL